MTEFADHFSTVASAYAAFRPRYPRELFAWLASISPRKGVAWDCATGSGQAATGLAEFFERVIATDASGDQVTNATKHPNVEYRTAPAEASGLAEGSAELITVAQAAHWFDLPRFYAEARRVAARGGVLALWCYGEMQFGDASIDRALKHYYDAIVGPFWPPERRFVEAGYATLHFPFERMATPEFQICAEFRLRDLAGYLRTWSATQRFVKANNFDPVLALEKELSSVWGENETRAARQWPISMLAARVNE